MILYVESNFVGELALGQAEAEAAERLLGFAEQSLLTIVIPAFLLSEPYSTLTQRERTRRNLRNSLASQLADLKRAEPHQTSAAALEPLLQLLEGLERREFERLQTAMQRILNVAETVPFTAVVLGNSLNAQTRFGLLPADAVVYASVVLDLGTRSATEEKIFASRNWRDFRAPAMVSELHALGCRYETSFADTVQYLQQSST